MGTPHNPEASWPEEAFIRLEDLYKSFGRKEVLRGIRLPIFRGETIVILGASGSGKSVLLRHIIGLHRPEGGEVWVDGVEVSHLSEEDLVETRKKVAMLFQGGALFDSMNVFENVAYSLREHTDMDEGAIAARVSETLSLVELGEDQVESLMPVDLSGGMRKRVALARAIALEPQAILYDEPTTGLDPITANHINRLIRNMQARLGVTSVVVTHDIESAFMVGDRIAFLLDGEMKFIGTVAEARVSQEPSLRRFLAGGLEPGQRPKLPGRGEPS
jgi:phospholipid/cholesterol/gamma-HCH transport system ATP-binding protein